MVPRWRQYTQDIIKKHTFSGHPYCAKVHGKMKNLPDLKCSENQIQEKHNMSQTNNETFPSTFI